MRGLWDTGDATEILVHLILLAALVGTILILGVCCKKKCYPDNRSGSYVSIKFERSSAERVGGGSEDVVVDPAADAAVRWAQVDGARVGLGMKVWRENGGVHRGLDRRMGEDVPGGEEEGEEMLECESSRHGTGSRIIF